MRIAYLVHQSLHRHVGGTEIYAHGLARRARAAGHEVVVLAAHDTLSADRRAFGVVPAEHEGVPIREVRFSLGAMEDPARAEFDNPFTAGLVASELERFAPDVVHAVHVMKLSGAALEVCHRLGRPVVATLCDFWYLCPRHTLLTSRGRTCDGPRTPTTCARCARDTHGFNDLAALRLPWDRAADALLRRGLSRGHRGKSWDQLRALGQRTAFLREALLRSRRIVALSEFLARAHEPYGYPAGRIEVLPHGVETEGLRPRTRSRGEGPFRLAFIGSLVPHKGAHVLLEAIRRRPDLPVECRVYGREPERGAYAARLRRLGRGESRLRWMGEFPPERLGDVLDEIDALAAPALWYENEPLVVKAAVHVGLPVLASRLGSLEGMVEDGVTGWRVAPGDVGAWGEAIARAIGEPLPDPGLGRVAIPDADRHARDVFEIYRAVVASNRPAGA